MILVGRGAAADAKRRLLERAGAAIVDEDEFGHGGAALAIVADGDEAAVARLRARGLLVNAVDRPDLCDFTLPAIVDRDPVLVAIGTGGVSAGLAAALRQRLEALLPDGLGAVARALEGARRALRERHPDPGERRQAIGALLAAGGPLDSLAGRDDPAVALAAALAAPVGGDPTRLERIAVASPDPEELTLRAARLLGQADRVHHPADMPEAILARARADAERIAGPPPVSPGPGLTVQLAWAS